MERWLRFEVTPQDVRRYALAVRARSWHRTTRTPAGRLGKHLYLVSVAGLFICALILTVLEGGVSWLAELAEDPWIRTLFALLLAVFGLLGAILVAQPRLVVWAASRRRDVLGPRRLRIGDEGIHMVTPSFTSVVAWSGISRVMVSDGDVHLHLSEAEAMLVPARAFATAADRDVFVQTCRRHIAAERITQSD